MEKMWKEQLQQMVKVHDREGNNKNLLGAALLALELGNEESIGKYLNALILACVATVYHSG